MIVLTCLELVLDKTIVDFEIAANDKNFGSFDDLIIETKDKVNKEYKQAIQLKHVNNTKILSTKSLESSLGGFSLGKYYQDNYKIVNDNFIYILYTNLRFQKDNEHLNLQYKKSKNKDAACETIAVTIVKDKDFSDCTGNTYKFTVNSDEVEVKAFFEKFRLKTDQDHLNQTYRSIEEKFKFLNTSSSLDHLLKFMKFIKDWSMKQRKKPKLDKNIVLMKLAEIVLSPFIRTISSSFHDTGKNKIIRKAILKFDVTVLEKPNEIVTKIWTNNRNLEDINKTGFRNFTIAEPLQQEDLESKDYAIISWWLKENPLIVESTLVSQDLILKIIQLFAQKEIRRKFVLLNYNHKGSFGTLKELRSLHDLKIEDTNLYESIASKFSCVFLGRNSSLKEILNSNDELTKVFHVDSLVAMANGELKIGNVNKEELPQFYVNRMLQGITINFDFVNQTDSDVIAITCCGEEDQVRSRIKNQENIILIDNLLNNYQSLQESINFVYLISNTVTDFQEVCRRHSDQNCHLFLYSQENLEWIESKGKISKTLRFFRVKGKSEQELQVLQNPQRKLNLLCANPGLGKTTTLKHFVNSHNAKYWHIFINAKESRKIKNKDVHEFAISFLSEDDAFQRNAFEIFYQKRKVVFFWDSIDEIFDDRQKQDVLYLIRKIDELNFSQWLASRTHLKEELEEEFNTLAKNIEEFDENQQLQYLQSRLKTFSQEEISTIFKKIHSNAEFLETNNFLGIPVQLYTLTEILLSTGKKVDIFNDPLTITNLYNHFIDGKLKVFFEKNKITDPHSTRVIGKYFRKTCEIWGIKICLESVTDLEFLTPFEKDFLDEGLKHEDPVGIIIARDVSSVTFLHHSYAEYFCAVFLSKNYARINKFREFYFDENLKNVRFMFDLILANNCPVHTAVLYKDLEKLEERNLLSEEDLGGRTPLHIALSWESSFSKLPNSIARKNIANYLTNFKTSTFLLQRLAEAEVNNFRRRDKLLQFDCFDYAHGNFLQIAVLSNDIKTVEFVLDSVNSCNENGDSSLMNAAFIGNLEITTFLMKKQADINAVNKYAQSALHFAVANNHLNVSKFLVEQGSNVNSADKDRRTPLMISVENGNLEILECLISNEAEVNLSKSDGETALHVAAWNNEIEIVKLLIEHNAKVNCSKENGWTPLMNAARDGHLEIAKFLIKNGAEVNLANRDGVTAFYVAGWNNRLEIAKLLVEHKVSVNCSEKDGWTPLMNAAWNGHLEIAKFLLDNEADVNLSKRDGITALYVAVRSKQMEVAKLLIEHKAEVNCRDKHGRTPLMYAAKRGHFEITKCLIDNRAEVNLSQSNGRTALHVAAKNNQPEIAEILIKNKSIVNCCDKYGWTPLLYAVRQKSLTLVRVLMQEADLGIIYESGDTALHVAICKNLFEIAQLLIGWKSVFNENENFVMEKNCKLPDTVQCLDLNCPGNHRPYPCKKCEWTPLMYASQEGHLETAEILIKNQADINRSNESGANCLHIAAWNNQKQIVQLLIQENAEVSAFSRFGLTPLLIATMKGNSSLAKYLILNSQTEVNRPDNFGFTPLIWVARKGYLEIAECLIENGANINAQNGKGETAVNFAAMENRFEIVKLLVKQKVDVNLAAVGGYTPLWRAATRGYFNILKYLIENGAIIKSIVLCNAVRNNHMEISKFLIKKGATVNYRTKKTDTPLHYAVRNKSLEMVKLLLENGADISLKNEQNQTAQDLRMTAEIEAYLLCKGHSSSSPTHK